MTATDTAAVTVMRSRVDLYAAGIDCNVRPTGPFVTETQRLDATDLAMRWLHAADDVRVTGADLDGVASLAATALDAIRTRDRREGGR